MNAEMMGAYWLRGCMTYKDSIIYRTGQVWKLQSLLGAGISAATMLIAYLYGDSGWFMPLIYFATVLAAVSLATPFFIRCPNCGVRWFWLATSKKHAEGWYNWLVSQSKCPRCGYNGVGKERRSARTS
jgi:DNA-directed RNA polymerase subunit RPC12/RpoP